MYALQRFDGLTWGRFTKDEAYRLANLYRRCGASDVPVKIQNHWVSQPNGSWTT